MNPIADDVRTVQPTIDYDSPSRAETTRSAPTPLPLASGEGGPSLRVEVVAGSGVHLSEVTRSLLQVRIKEVDEANVLFDQLMGDLVEPRRQFIQDNALSASVDA